MHNEIQKTIDTDVVAKIKPYNSCCWRLQINKNGEEIESGIWCPKSTILSVNGAVAGYASTPEEVLNNLKLINIPKWILVDTEDAV